MKGISLLKKSIQQAGFSNRVHKFQGGKRKREGVEEEQYCKCLRMERKKNHKFFRKFMLPSDANVKGISASCGDGVLSVIVPRFRLL